ncbi:MAG TPA: hypothetical protein VGH73_04385 [Thermoanaerobaculia bacterium]|jgi:hypothetical protein
MTDPLNPTERRFAAVVEALAAEPRVGVGAGKKGFGSSALKVGDKFVCTTISRLKP